MFVYPLLCSYHNTSIFIFFLFCLGGGHELQLKKLKFYDLETYFRANMQRISCDGYFFRAHSLAYKYRNYAT